MSEIRVNKLIDEAGTGAVELTQGATIPTGKNITGAGGISITGDIVTTGTLTYEDVTNIDSVGVVTARAGIKVLAGGINAVGVVTATSFSGDGSALTGVESWNQQDTWLYGGG